MPHLAHTSAMPFSSCVTAALVTSDMLLFWIWLFLFFFDKKFVLFDEQKRLKHHSSPLIHPFIYLAYAFHTSSQSMDASDGWCCALLLLLSDDDDEPLLFLLLLLLRPLLPLPLRLRLVCCCWSPPMPLIWMSLSSYASSQSSSCSSSYPRLGSKSWMAPCITLLIQSSALCCCIPLLLLLLLLLLWWWLTCLWWLWCWCGGWCCKCLWNILHTACSTWSRSLLLNSNNCCLLLAPPLLLDMCCCILWTNRYRVTDFTCSSKLLPSRLLITVDTSMMISLGDRLNMLVLLLLHTTAAVFVVVGWWWWWWWFGVVSLVDDDCCCLGDGDGVDGVAVDCALPLVLLLRFNWNLRWFCLSFIMRLKFTGLCWWWWVTMEVVMVAVVWMWLLWLLLMTQWWWVVVVEWSVFVVYCFVAMSTLGGESDDNEYRQMMKRLLCFSRLCK